MPTSALVTKGKASQGNPKVVELELVDEAVIVVTSPYTQYPIPNAYLISFWLDMTRKQKR
jgi:hypothetical protein